MIKVGDKVKRKTAYQDLWWRDAIAGHHTHPKAALTVKSITGGTVRFKEAKEQGFTLEYFEVVSPPISIEETF